MNQFVRTIPKDSRSPEYACVLYGDLNAPECAMILFRIKMLESSRLANPKDSVGKLGGPYQIGGPYQFDNRGLYAFPNKKYKNSKYLNND